MATTRDDYVLIVDDDVDIGEAIEIILQTRGYYCVIARDGLEALERLQADPLPRVVLLDLMMPGMNGLQFRAKQLEDARIANVPVVVMTGDANADEKVAGMGLWRHLRKPVLIDELLEAVRSAA